MTLGFQGIENLRKLEKKFGKPHEALKDFREPHESQIWLVNAFLRLHYRRSFGGMGSPLPISYTEMLGMADGVLGLQGDMRQLFFSAVEEMDAVALESMNKKSSSDDNST